MGTVFRGGMPLWQPWNPWWRTCLMLWWKVQGLAGDVISTKQADQVIFPLWQDAICGCDCLESQCRVITFCFGWKLINIDYLFAVSIQGEYTRYLKALVALLGSGMSYTFDVWELVFSTMRFPAGNVGIKTLMDCPSLCHTSEKRHYFTLSHPHTSHPHTSHPHHGSVLQTTPSPPTSQLAHRSPLTHVYV